MKKIIHFLFGHRWLYYTELHDVQINGKVKGSKSFNIRECKICHKREQKIIEGVWKNFLLKKTDNFKIK